MITIIIGVVFSAINVGIAIYKDDLFAGLGWFAALCFAIALLSNDLIDKI